ncbi:MAG: PadR family transcriptional regulator [Planctomycetota bacterium]
MSRLRKQTLDGQIETLLLATLEEGPSYGYQIVKDLNERAGDLLRLGEGTVYPVLHRMEERGVLSCSWRKGDRGQPRKYYRLNARGKKALAEQRQQWAGLQQVMNTVLGNPA